jgi:hypothetical protein
MTTRYPLRSRVGVIPASADTHTHGESPPSITVSTDNAAPGAETTQQQGVTMRSYRDVVAPKPTIVSTASQYDEGSLVEPDSLSVGLVPRETSLNKELTDGGSKLTSFSSIPEDEGGPWTLVVPRRARSAESLRGRGSASVVRTSRGVATPDRNILTWEQERAIVLAKESMTTTERAHIKERNIKLNIPEAQSDNDPSDRDEGPSKGKGPDPRNWGVAGIEASEMNIEAQRAAFDAYAVEHLTKKASENLLTPVNGRDNPHTRNKYRATVEEIADMDEPLKSVKKSTPPPQRHNPEKPAMAMEGVRYTLMADTAKDRIARTVSRRSNSKSVKPGLRPEMRPISQIAPGSYLANALANVGQAAVSGHGSPSSSDSSSSSSDSSGDTSESDTLSSESSSCRKRRRGHHGKRRTSRTPKRKRTSPKSLLKPIAPKEYDGSPDARAYHRFITEGSDYVRTGKVSKTRQVFVLSYYLKSRAYDFYTQKVALNVHSWTLQQFFEELFNYCFPINYRMKQRERLRRAFQHEKSVSDYCHELEELYNMIGTVDEREKVVKLWNGL